MAILFPNTPATWRRRTGRTLQGRPTYSAATDIMIGVVRLFDLAARTSVRADSSASRGRSEEEEADAVILVPPQHKVAIGDAISIGDRDYEIVSAFPRRDVPGRVRHHECALRRRQEG